MGDPKVGDKTTLNSLHWGCEFMMGTVRLMGKHEVFDSISRTHDEIEILAYHISSEETDWGTYYQLTIFKHIKTGYLGFYEYIPAGWSSYTYDPDQDCRLYDTTDMDWFYRYALDQSMRDLPEVSMLLIDKQMDDLLRGEDDGENKS